MKKNVSSFTVYFSILMIGLAFLLSGCSPKPQEGGQPSKEESKAAKIDTNTKVDTDKAANEASAPTANSKEEVPGTPKEVVVINGEKEFVDFITNNPMVVIDFTATWCGPCQRLAPLLEEMAVKNKDKGIKFAKVDVDANRPIATEYNIKGIPDVRFFSGGKEFKKVVGLNPAGIEAALNSLMAQKGSAPKDYGNTPLEDELWKDK